MWTGAGPVRRLVPGRRAARRPGAPGLDEVEVVQPLLFSVMVSLAAVWRAHGVEPDAVVGHSQGELAAAYVCGSLTLQEAARAVALRSRAIARIAGTGGLLSIALPADRVMPYLERSAGELSVAVVNSPRSTAVGGSPEALAALAAACERDGVRSRLILIDYASHSPQVEAIRDEVLDALKDVSPRRSDIPFFSSTDGGPLDTLGLDAGYWFRNLREAVQFERATRALLDSGHNVFIEVSPHPVLVAGMLDTIEDAAQASPDEPVEAAVVGTLQRDEGGVGRFLRSAAEAYVHGVPVDWAKGYAGTGARRVKLPGYPFERRRTGWQPPGHRSPAHPPPLLCPPRLPKQYRRSSGRPSGRSRDRSASRRRWTSSVGTPRCSSDTTVPRRSTAGWPSATWDSTPSAPSSCASGSSRPPA